jgi:hypothetical protein
MSRRRAAFTAVVLLTLGLAGLFASMVGLMNVQPGFMGMSHFSEEHHRVHDVTFSLLNGTVVVGMLAQLRRPTRNVAGQVTALIPFAALLLAAALTNGWVLSPPWLALGATTVLATTLHPAGDPLRWFSGARADRVMLALVGAAAIPLLAFAWTNIGLQRAGPTDHALAGHYGYMAAFSFAVIAVALLASVRPAGWRPVAWVAGALPVVLGIVSLIYPTADSRLDGVWAAIAIGWGIAFVTGAELRGRAEVPGGA